MRKIFIFSAICIVCAGCSNYQTNIDEYLSYWSTEAAIARYGVDPAVTLPTDKDGTQNIPSANDVDVTLTLRNPKSFTFKLPGKADSPTDIVVFRPEVKGSTGANQPEPLTDYELKQDSSNSLTFTFKKAFLQKYEYGENNIGPTITLYADDGRKFSQTFTFNIKANTPPPSLIYRAVGKTAAADADGNYYYVLFLEAAGMDTLINGSALLHGDIANLAVAEGSGEYAQIPLTVKEDKSGFDISSAAGRLLADTETVQLLPTDIESSAGMPDTLPLSTEKWILRIKTDVAVKGAVKQYRFLLRDKAGLSSADELAASTSTNKVNPVSATVQSGNWSITPKSGTETEPHEIAYQHGVEKIPVQAATIATGAAVHYKLERGGSTVSENSGTTPVTIELPAIRDAVYKLTAWAVKDGFDNSPTLTVYYKLKTENWSEITGGNGAWTQLKVAVAAAGDGHTVFINGTIQATAGGNYGEIPITQKITIKGITGAAADILDANKSALNTKAHRIFNIQSGGELTLENLTLTNGKAAGSGEDDKRGGAVLIADGGALSMTGCTVRNCESDNEGGAILVKNQSSSGRQVLSMSNCIITGNKTVTGTGSGGALCIEGGKTEINNTVIAGNTSAQNGGGIYLNGTAAELTVTGGSIGTDSTQAIGNSAQNGGGIFIYKGSCTLNNVTIQGNTVDASGNGSGIFLHKSTDNAELTVAGAAKIGSSTDTNTLCVGMLPGQSAFVTVTDLDSTAHINIKPVVYDQQKNKTLVKVTGSPASSYKDYFRLIDVPSGQTWELNPNSGDTELVLENKLEVNGGGASNGAWKKLKEAVTNAGDGDIIIVDGLIQATNDADNHDEIKIYKNLTIRGKSGTAATDILDANSNHAGTPPSNAPTQTHRIFKVVDGKTLTLENLTLKGGQNAQGGGILVTNGTLVMNGCTVTECTAQEKGGGIYSQGTLKICHGELKLNTAKAGGGAIYVEKGSVTLEDEVSVTANTTDNSNGGAIYVDKEGTLNVTNASITANYAQGTGGNGGGIFVTGDASYQGKVIISGGTIDFNSAESGSTNTGFGGGICAQGGTVTMTGGTVTQNKAVAGGGVALYQGGTLTLSGTGEINDNTATIKGGGICAEGISTKRAAVTIDGGTINANQASGPNTSGGGIYVNQYADAALTGAATVTGNTATNGGGVYNEGGTFTMSSGEIKDNTADNNGGGIALDKGGTLTLSGGKINGNTAQKYGGGICIGTDANANENTGTVTMTGGEVSNNTASRKDGGGVAVLHGTFTMSNGKVSGNTAKESGGGIYGMNFNQAKGEITVSGGEISGNTANISGTLAGGGIKSGYKLTVSGGTIKNNKTTKSGGWGGGIAVSEGVFKFSGGTVVGNTCQGGGTVQGTGIYVWKCSVEMSGSAKVDTNNDVHLSGTSPTNAKITVSGPLTGTAPVARITPENYSTSIRVLEGSAVSTEYTKFRVTPNGGQNWSVGSNGYLTTP